MVPANNTQRPWPLNFLCSLPGVIFVVAQQSELKSDVYFMIARKFSLNRKTEFFSRIQ